MSNIVRRVFLLGLLHYIRLIQMEADGRDDVNGITLSRRCVLIGFVDYIRLLQVEADGMGRC